MPKLTIIEQGAMINEIFPYIGQYTSGGNDGKNRISFIQPVREMFMNRKEFRGWGTLIGHSEQKDSIKYITLWDYLPRVFNPGEGYYIKLKLDKENTRLLFPKEIILPKGKLIWKGLKHCIQICREQDLEKLSL
jgi:hypothetical protein